MEAHRRERHKDVLARPPAAGDPALQRDAKAAEADDLHKRVAALRAEDKVQDEATPQTDGAVEAPENPDRPDVHTVSGWRDVKLGCDEKEAIGPSLGSDGVTTSRDSSYDPQDEDDVREVEELGKPTADGLDADDCGNSQSGGSDETEYSPCSAQKFRGPEGP